MNEDARLLLFMLLTPPFGWFMLCGLIIFLFCGLIVEWTEL